jgi:RNA polymerase sigma-54 factor
MKTAMQTKQGQHLVLTPQLLQSIRLLHLDAMTLEQEIAQAISINPLLERVEDGDLAAAESLAGCAAPETMASPADIAGMDTTRRYDEDDWRSRQRVTSAGDGSADGDAIAASTPNAALDVREQIRQQLELSRLGTNELAIADWLLDETDDAGYLIGSVDDLRQRLPAGLGDGANIEQVRQLILHAEPAGVCACSLSECLAVQLYSLAPSALRDHALCAVRMHLELLGQRDPQMLATALGVDHSIAQEVFRLVLSLDPKPALPAPDLRSIAVIPEVSATRRDGRWHVEINPLSSPQVRVDPEVARLIEASAGDPRAVRIRELMQQAFWLTRGLAMRYDTLLRVAEVIVRRQGEFLDRGREAMAPLTLREVADELRIHESTVSRIAAGKYLQTPRGTFELRSFFSTRLAGAAVANVAVQAMVKRLIAQENPNAPLADDQIVLLLARQGVQIARRTVAKYRDVLNIASARARRTPETCMLRSAAAR